MQFKLKQTPYKKATLMQGNLFRRITFFPPFHITEKDKISILRFSIVTNCRPFLKQKKGVIT